MADWVHKERTWVEPQMYSFGEPEMSATDADLGPESFIQWLDWQCEGGWEVCNISIIKLKERWLGFETGKLCIFRKKN
jgi:hypothetical protein